MGPDPVGPAYPGMRYPALNGKKPFVSMTADGKGAANGLGSRSRYTHLFLDDPTFGAWYLNVLRGSFNTGSAYLRRTGRICDEMYQTTPQQIARMNETELMTFISNLVSDLEADGVIGATIKSYVKAVKSWVRFSGKKVDGRINIPESDNRYGSEKVPRPEEVQTLLDHASPRVKVAASLVAFGGLRPEAIGSADGRDGLKVKDFPEIEVRDGVVNFPKVPTLLVVRKKISKTRRAYVSFVFAEACEDIRQYLEDRMREGKVLTLESAIVTVSKFSVRRNVTPLCRCKKPLGEHITTTNVRDSIRAAVRAAGFGWRPYVLRRYFDTRMMLAEADWIIIHDLRSFWMGHAGNIEFVYTLDKGLDEETVEKMRSAHAKAANRYLCVSGGPAEEDLVTKIRKQILLTVLTSEEIERLHVGEKTDEEIIALLRERLMQMTFNGVKQKLVPLNEVEEWISRGWTWKGNLGDGRAVLEPVSS